MSQALRRTQSCLMLLALSGVFGVSMTARPVQAQSASQSVGGATSEKTTPENSVPEKREEEKDENENFRRSPMVQKMGHMLGMSPDAAATAFTALNFLILIAGVGYLLMKTLPGSFRNRNSAIQKNLVEARTATEEANARLKAVETRLGRLDTEIAGMRQQAEADAARDDQRMRDTMEQETAKILSSAETEIQAATAAARRALQQHAAELAVEQAARRLVITPETDRKLIEGFAARLAESKGGQN